MVRLTGLAFASTALGLASAQYPTVTQIMFPGADQQPLDASVIGEDGDVKTIAMQCSPDTPSDECGFFEPLTLTVGPSTLHVNPTSVYEWLGEIDCRISASTEADCTAAYGVYPDPTGTDYDDSYPTAPPASSTTASTILSADDVVWLSVTLTAGDVSGASASTTSTSTSSDGSTATVTSSSRSTGATGATASGTATSSSELASASENTAAGSSRIAYMGLAAALVAGSMMML